MQTEKLNPKMLTLAREARGYSQHELADITGISRSNITKFEQDDRPLPEESFKIISGVLKFTDDFYYRHLLLMPPAIYRRRETVPAKKLIRTDAMIHVYVLGINRLLQAIKQPEPKLPVYTVTENSTAGEAAQKLRRQWKMAKGAIPDLTKVLEEHGVITIPFDFETERIDSHSTMIENKYPVIFYNSTILGDRLRFTLAHELGRLVLHSKNVDTPLDKRSREASQFASAFLLPEEEVIKDLQGIDKDGFGALKLKWGASMHALLYRAEDLGVITNEQKEAVLKYFNNLRIRRREPAEFDLPIERGHLLRDLITSYRGKQKMTLKEIAAFFYMYEDEFLSRYNTK
jgi:Zn-dependent peptidase ImmA (M78 family)/DNA-binding XRE family transcriptional regulator